MNMINRFIKKLKNPNLWILIASIILSVFYATIPPIQNWVATNSSFVQNWQENTKMPSSVLIVFGILVAGSIIYLFFDALKESDIDRVEKKLDKIIVLLAKERGDQNNGNKNNNPNSDC